MTREIRQPAPEPTGMDGDGVLVMIFLALTFLAGMAFGAYVF